MNDKIFSASNACDIPQGSVLGPILFLLDFIYITHSKTYKFPNQHRKPFRDRTRPTALLIPITVIYLLLCLRCIYRVQSEI